jgi:hypothetical protein
VANRLSSAVVDNPYKKVICGHYFGAVGRLDTTKKASNGRQKIHLNQGSSKVNPIKLLERW